jgi:hypothetical protein
MKLPTTDVVANIAMIATCVLACGTLVYKTRMADSVSAASVSVGLRPGDKIILPKPVPSSTPYTLVMYVRSTCHFCTESMPFYEALSRERSKGQHWTWVVAAGEPIDTARAYLSSHHVEPDDVISVPPTVPTPTLVLVDRTGVIKKVWTGALDSSGQQEVRATLNKI